jgi:hypothetical protein
MTKLSGSNGVDFLLARLRKEARDVASARA